jgi:hypothetical protein
MAGRATFEEQAFAFLDLRLRTHRSLRRSCGADRGVTTPDDKQRESE